VVYDYVTYIAINPAKREEYVNLIKIFSKCSRVIIAPWFPVEERGEPPFRIIWKKRNHSFLKFSTTENDTINPRRGREVLQIY